MNDRDVYNYLLGQRERRGCGLMNSYWEFFVSGSMKGR